MTTCSETRYSSRFNCTLLALALVLSALIVTRTDADEWMCGSAEINFAVAQNVAVANMVVANVFQGVPGGGAAQSPLRIDDCNDDGVLDLFIRQSLPTYLTPVRMHFPNICGQPTSVRITFSQNTETATWIAMDAALGAVDLANTGFSATNQTVLLTDPGRIFFVEVLGAEICVLCEKDHPGVPPVVFDDLVYRPVGGASAGIVDDGLVLSNIGASGDDGVHIEPVSRTGPATCWEADLFAAPGVRGDPRVELTALVGDDGAPAQSLSTLDLALSEESTQVRSADVGAEYGPALGYLRGVSVYREGTLVHRQQLDETSVAVVHLFGRFDDSEK